MKRYFINGPTAAFISMLVLFPVSMLLLHGARWGWYVLPALMLLLILALRWGGVNMARYVRERREEQEQER